MKWNKKWRSGLFAAALTAVFTASSSFAAMAEEADAPKEEISVRNGWIDENLGPGVARWVDENGNISEQPGVSGEESSQAAEETQAEGQETAEGVLPEEAGQEEGQQTENQETGQEASAGRQLDPSKPMVALTFDDGPFAPVGNQIMDCLALYGGKATFFVVGDRAASYQEELKRMVAEGHEIGNHTYSHKYLTKLSAAQIQEQIRRCDDAVQAVCGVRPALVRLPGGLKNATVLANVPRPIIMWSIDTLDWKTRNAGKTVNAVLSQVRDGDIVLMHELYSQTGAAAVQLIPALTQAGYQLVTVSELAQYRGGVAAGGQYSRFYR